MNLLQDEDETHGSTPAKKRKLNTGNANNVKFEAEQSRAPYTGANMRPLGPHGAPTGGEYKTGSCAFTQQANFVSLMNAELNGEEKVVGIAPLSPRPSASIPASRGFAASAPATSMRKQLDIVRAKLELAAKCMSTSRNIMKKAYDEGGEDLNRRETMPALTLLSKCFATAEEEARRGAEHIDRVVELVFQE